MNSNENIQFSEDLGLIIVSNNDILNPENIENVISGLITYPYFMYKYNYLIDVRNSVGGMTS